jgi:hypothetical protein
VTTVDEYHYAPISRMVFFVCLRAFLGGAIVVRRATIINRWYVSIQGPSDWRPTTSRAPFPRKTKTFPTESDAKLFAKAMLTEGMKVTAGTLSPHKPRRRTIIASEINKWIEES